MPLPVDIANAAALAALLEASVEKPGSVTPTKSFADLEYSDFLNAALSIRPHMAKAARRGALAADSAIGLDEIGIGKIIYDAFEPGGSVARRKVNVNFGIVLMFVPLAAAAGYGGTSLRKSLKAVLRDATPTDTVWIYKAMRKCDLGGMRLRGGGLSGLDVYSDAALTKIRREGITPLDVFRKSAGIDRLASEWVSGYKICFECSKKIELGGDSILKAFLGMLSKYPDTLIARKAGLKEAEKVSAMARQALNGRRSVASLDSYLRSKGNKLNPGTTCDLTATALFLKAMG